MQDMTWGKPHIRPVRDLRNNYAEIAALLKEHKPVFITNQGRGEAVVIHIDDYAAYEQYLYNQYALKMLAEAECEASKPDAVWNSLDDVDRIMREKLDVL